MHVEGVVRRFGYARLKRVDKGLVVRYLMRTTGYSRPQLVRLIKRARRGALKKGYRAPTHGFARRYPDADVALPGGHRHAARHARGRPPGT